MGLRGAGGSAAAVPPRPAAKQDNAVTGIGIFPDHVSSGRRPHDRADLHSLCHIVPVVDLFYIACCKPHLIPVGRIALCRASHQPRLGKFSLQRLRGGQRGIRRTGNPHRLIYIAPSG